MEETDVIVVTFSGRRAIRELVPRSQERSTSKARRPIARVIPGVLRG
jgi:hypothetical protein